MASAASITVPQTASFLASSISHSGFPRPPRGSVACLLPELLTELPKGSLEVPALLLSSVDVFPDGALEVLVRHLLGHLPLSIAQPLLGTADGALGVQENLTR